MSMRVLCAQAILATMFLTAAVPEQTVAQESMEPVYYGYNLNVSLGAVIPSTDEFSNSFYIRGGAGYELNEHLAIDFGIGRFVSDVEHGMVAPPSNTIADGELKVLPLTATLQLRFPVPQLFGTVYGNAGLGYYFIDYTWSGSSKSYFSEVAALYDVPHQDVSDSFGFHLGGGFDYPLTSQLFLNAEGNYLFLNPDADGEWRDLLTGEPYSFNDGIDLNSWILSLGIKYLF